MNQGTHPEELPAEVLDDVASVVGAEVTLLGRLPGGVNAGALRVQLAGSAERSQSRAPGTPRQLDETLRAQRVVERMRRRGYPTPAWLGVGATATHVWHLMDFVDAAPAPELTPSLVEQLMEIVELQAGQASEPYDHWSYAWRVATGQESAVAGLVSTRRRSSRCFAGRVARLSGYSSVVSALVERLRLVCADVPPPPEAPDMVHADLNPSNVLVCDGAVVAVVDIENAGSGTRATDLTTLQWHTFQDPLDGARRRLRTESSTWSAGRGQRCSRRRRSSRSSSGPSVRGATMSLQGWSSAAIAPSTSWTRLASWHPSRKSPIAVGSGRQRLSARCQTIAMVGESTAAGRVRRYGLSR